MGIGILEAISLMAELEKSGLVCLESSGDLILKELGGALWNELPQINTKLQKGITNYLKFFLRMRRRGILNLSWKEKVTKYDRDYIWGLVQDQFRRTEVLAEFVFNGLYSVWNNRVRKEGG